MRTAWMIGWVIAFVMNAAVAIGADPPPPPYAKAEVSQSAVAFGEVDTHATSSVTITVTSAGNASLEVSGVSVSGGGTEIYLGGEACSGKGLVPGAACTFEVVFAPVARGAKAASVLIASNAGEDVVIGVSGTGVEADVEVSPGVLELGDVYVGESVEGEVTVANVGDGDLKITSVALGGGAGFWVVSDGCGGMVLGPGVQCGVVVGYEAVSVGGASGVLEVSSGDPDEAVVSVVVNARGVRADIGVYDSAGDSGDLLVDFGEVTEGLRSEHVVTVVNEGTGVLGVSSVVVSGEGFSITSDGCSGAGLGAGEGCTVAVEFWPAYDAPGYEGVVVIGSDDFDEAVVEVGLLGVGMSSGVNHAPMAAEPTYPGDGAELAVGDVGFKWAVSEDADGDDVGYRLVVADNEGFDGAVEFDAEDGGSGDAGGMMVAVAGYGGMMVVGLMGMVGGRRRVAGLACGVMVVGVVGLVACGGGGGAGGEAEGDGLGTVRIAVGSTGVQGEGLSAEGLPGSVDKVAFRISGEGMQTIVRLVLGVGKAGYVEEEFAVPVGDARLFEVEAYGADGGLRYSGSTWSAVEEGVVDVVVRMGAVSEVGYTVKGLQAGTYWWKVVATDGDDQNESPPRSFTLK